MVPPVPLNESNEVIFFNFNFFNNEEIPDSMYPKDYPSAALLGCVNVVDCASNEEYFEKVWFLDVPVVFF